MPAAEPKPATHFACPLIIKGFCSLLLMSFFLLPVAGIGQRYSYVHYDTKDGLAGSTIYDICQDKDGFIWFATEAGLSRFDGTRFRNYTTADGLPEVEILKLYADHAGRVWIAPFKNTLCYYYQGKIYTAANDPMLRKVKLHTVITYINGDIEDNIFLSSVGHGAYLLKTGKGQESFTDLSAYGRRFWFGYPHFSGYRGLMLTTKEDSLFELVDGRLQYYQDRDGQLKVIQDRMRVMEADFLKGKQLNCSLVDYEKNTWFGSSGEGIYKLVSRNFKTYVFPHNKIPEIFSLARYQQRLLAGGAYNRLYAIEGSRIDSIPFNRPYKGAFMQTESNRLVAIQPLSNGDLVLGFDLFLLKRSASGNHVNYTFPIKSVEETDPHTLLVSTGRNVVRVRQEDLQILDTLWPYRSTAVSYYNKKVYVGTVDGLYVLNGRQPAYRADDSLPALRYRISSFVKPEDGSLWIATYGGGIIGLKGDKVIGYLTTGQGLTSNICRSLFAHKQFLWVGTDKGINKIDLSQPSYPIHRYSIADGLPSNMINTIYVDSHTVYVGSPAGLTFFDESKVSDYSRCDLRMLDISVSGKSNPLQSSYELRYSQNDLRFEFTGISFKSGGDILYRYRLKGLRDNWDSTRQNQLSYPSLPPGRYQLELVAINKFGVVSNALVIPILIATPFWQTWWFMGLMVVLTIISTALLVSWRFSIVRRREKEKVSLQQKITELEQLALLAQMNPHFIFNCLNSIQSFIINNDLAATNQYLTEFAHLIRQTMDGAEKGVISIANEVKYLTRYIELEKMRFGQSFDHRIVVDEQIDKDHVFLPSLLLQPYVENSLRHGIRHKKDGKGFIEIRFRQSGNRLLCIVEDNGIGRETARQFRSKVPMEYQSKGMTLAAERIKALNRQYAEAAGIAIIDKADGEQKPTGTRVVLSFPYKMLTKLS